MSLFLFSLYINDFRMFDSANMFAPDSDISSSIVSKDG